MTDTQIKQAFGVDETREMLQLREQLKSQMTPELYEQNMAVHKASIQVVINQSKNPLHAVEAAEIVVDMLDADTSLEEDQREIWKAIVVLAAFEMSEF